MCEIIQIKYNSDNYIKSVKLRDEILRKPLGMVFLEKDLSIDKNDFIICVKKDDQIIGTLNLSPLSNSVLKMRQVAIANSLQSSGLGSKLVKYSEQFAKNKEYESIVLNARNTAVKFYKKLNYKIEGDGFFELGILHYKMYKKL